MSAEGGKSSLIERVAASIDAGETPERPMLRDAVRQSLAEIARRAPGRAVEVRIPPFGAVQCGEGPRHSRGTPSNEIETDPLTWIKLVTGRLTWRDAVSAGLVRASGIRADISEYLPL